MGLLNSSTVVLWKLSKSIIVPNLADQLIHIFLYNCGNFVSDKNYLWGFQWKQKPNGHQQWGRAFPDSNYWKLWGFPSSQCSNRLPNILIHWICLLWKQHQTIPSRNNQPKRINKNLTKLFNVIIIIYIQNNAATIEKGDIPY